MMPARSIVFSFVVGVSSAVIACGGGDESSGGPKPVGPPPASKEEAAQQMNDASVQLSAAIKEASANAKKQSVGIHPQTTVTINGGCAGGGTLDVQASGDVQATATTGNQEAKVNAQYTITAHACKTATGYIFDGGPLSLASDVSTSVVTSDGGVSSTVHTSAKYNGSMTVTGPLAAAFSYENLTIISDVGIATSAGAASGKVSVVVDGKVSDNGATFQYANETVQVSISR